MKLVFPFFAGAMAQNSFLPPAQNYQPQVQPAGPMGGMDPMMMMLLLGDNKGKSKTDKLLPLMMMGGMGGAGGAGGMGGMDPMMMMLLLDDNKSSSSSSNSMKELLPLMMMSGGMGGAGGQPGQPGGMNPMMMMLMMGDDCEVKDAIKKAIKEAATTATLTVTDDQIKDLSRGVKCIATNTLVNCDDTTNKPTAVQIDHDFIKCETGGSGMSDMLPLMMMGGGMGGEAGGMNSMLPLMLMGGSSGMSDMLPLMMMGGMGGAGGQAGGMDPMMMMMLMGDDDTLVACDEKYKIDFAFKADGTKKLGGDTMKANVRDLVKVTTSLPDGDILGTTKSTWETDYAKCLEDAKTEGDSSSSMKDLLPLMMMGGMGGAGGQAGGMGGMDPMMMMALM